MEETYNKGSRGFLLISSLIVLSTMIIIVSFYLSSVIQEVRVSHIINTSEQAYYLAEAGIQEAFWKLQNNAAFKNSFETDPNFSATFTRNDSLISGGSYTVTINNQNLANATITATSTISVRDAQSQRVVKIGVFKALNDSPTTGIAAFSNNDIYSIGSKVSITGGDIFSNEDIKLYLFSDWTTTNNAKAHKKINVSASSYLDASASYDEDSPPIPEEIQMTQVDFDSTDPGSLKSQASQIYSSQEFKNLLDDFPITELNGIIYVTGDVKIKKGDTLTINGALAADGSIDIGNGFSFKEENASITVNKAASAPSGIFSKKNITIGGFSANAYVEGLIYSGGKLRIQDGIHQDVNVHVIGGIAAQSIDVFASLEPVILEHNQTYIHEAFGTPLFSQILFINHWEEEY